MAVYAAFKPDTNFDTKPPEDYVVQPFHVETLDWPDKPLTQTQLESRTRTSLESGKYPMAEAWFAGQLDPRNQDEATDKDEACRLPDGGQGEDPGLGRGTSDTGEEFLRRYEQVPEDVYPTAGYPSLRGPVYMRWGLATPNIYNTHIEWKGWGYRKIKAKHGWSEKDRDATRDALLGNATPHPKIPGRYTYLGTEYHQNGVRCKRLVTVEYEKGPDEVEGGAPSSAGIITSFGARIG